MDLLNKEAERIVMKVYPHSNIRSTTSGKLRD